MTQRNLIFAAILFISPLPVCAGPPFSYESALHWSDETVKTDIPQAERIYILGPDQVTESYILDNKPTLHDVDVRRVVQWKESSTLEAALESIPRDENRKIDVSVYRAGIEPSKRILSLTLDDTKELAVFRLKPRDVVLIEYVPPPGERPTPTI